MSTVSRAASTRAAAGRPRTGPRRPREEFDPTPWPVALGSGVAGGFCALLAFPPYDLWMLLPVGIALLCAGLLVRSAWLAGLVALLWGLAFFVPLTEWASTYAGSAPWLALGVFEALYIVVFGLAARAVMVRRGLCASTAIVVSALWVGVETLRGTAPWGGLTWGASGFALSDSPLLHLAPWIGMAGLALVVALLGQLLLLGALALLGRRHRGLTGFAGVWPFAIAVAAVLATVVVPHPLNRAPAERTSMTVAAVQGSMGEIDPVSYTMPEDVLDNHLEASEDAIEQARAAGTDLELVIWPEDSTGIDPRTDPFLTSRLSSLAQEADAPVLVGTQTPVGESERLNQSLLVTDEGETPYAYSKRHPVPFGEYIPMRGLFSRLTDKVDLVTRDMLPGQEIGTMDLSALGQGEGTAGLLICFEIAYEGLVQDVVDDGAEMIVVQSNNALFGDSHEAIQQLAQARVMAVLSGRSVVHVSTVGHSAIYSPEGRQIDFVDHWEQGTMVADVPLRTGTTPAVAAGPWIAIGLSALGVVGLLAALSSPRRALARTASRRGDR
ncbi:MAG TPA: apolipoprotein N-acyltransferase [Candidatus Brachybacterium intestinipullorum]|uniref:Apolipoprotein N-acyltransferase n=1 Tax=Candidatus Brachybacterium intestinipullorum TaxID=2838512 RepID=A0A9D2THI3_9MICO|nr:apolipoprotein N-acyltransferase [Candidatus Brachybacterium intestinipullorum]